MSRLLLVRHGKTKLNSTERFWGQTDVELSAEGIRQAERLRDRLAAQKIDSIYASNLRRALLTAEIIASRHQLQITSCAELSEINFGYVEGLKFEEISQLYPELRLPKLVSQFLFGDNPHGVPPRHSFRLTFARVPPLAPLAGAGTGEGANPSALAASHRG